MNQIIKKTSFAACLIIFYLQFNDAIAAKKIQKNNINEDWATSEIIIEVGSDNLVKKSYTQNIPDPFEKMNRKIFAFNSVMDMIILRPISLGYHKFVPFIVKNGVSSFFANLKEPLYLLHGILRLDKQQILRSFSRLTVNTTFGMLGMFDVAKLHGMPQYERSADYTLGSYGIPSGPYIVLPLLGPSTFRTTSGKILDFFTDPLDLTLHYKSRFIIIKIIVDGIVKREYLLKYDDEINELSLDRYTFFKSLYLQKIQQNSKVRGDSK